MNSKCAPLQYNTSPGAGMSSNKPGDNGRTMTSSQPVSPSHANLPFFLGLQLQPQGALTGPQPLQHASPLPERPPPCWFLPSQSLCPSLRATLGTRPDFFIFPSPHETLSVMLPNFSTSPYYMDKEYLPIGLLVPKSRIQIFTMSNNQ